MKYLIQTIFLLLPLLLPAQAEHRITVTGKVIEFEEIDDLSIIGTDEKDLRISRRGGSKEVDEKMKGMRKISADGKVDNTGFGLSAEELDGRVVISQVGKNNGTIIVHVPNSASVKVTQSTYRGDDLEVDNFKGELDVSMMYHDVNLTNVYGPLAINTVYGGIEATFSAGPPTEDLRLHSTYSTVDVSLPQTTPATLRLSTGYGAMYTDFDLDVKANMPKSDATVRRDRDDSGSKNSGLTGTINGGGILINLRATYKDIYVRKL
ncbi:DUF4097 family beta strand repeat-containing protein [Neolewinella antarctica]|uniref:Adhesin domain-containing protein n=1 Tax=Neolewinella antarctica TaxID=442734 RepID=A0ABX0XFE0_9BACT|nr:hypothetical protein [Neolewinella antarctica]NJC27598.1 hypothetical protein [Neolewinella antarctica]